ncbi:MAG: hypothetical protein ACOYMA_06060 [Bacteroidia bacterium]
MKKIIAILFIVFLYSSCVKEKYTDLVKTDSNKEMFVGKWTVSYVDQGFSPKVGDFILFNSDGTTTLMYSGGFQQGTWSLTESTLTSDVVKNYFTQGNTSLTKYNVIKIAEKEIILATYDYKNTYKIKMIK